MSLLHTPSLSRPATPGAARAAPAASTIGLVRIPTSSAIPRGALSVARASGERRSAMTSSVSETEAIEDSPTLAPTVQARKAVTTAPLPAPIQHSTSYVLKDRPDFGGEEEETTSEPGSAGAPGEEEEFSIKDVLRKADAHLNNMEAASTERNILWEAAESPIGQNTVKGLSQAADITVKGSKWAATEGLKAAKPAGKWLAGQLGSAIGDIVSKAAKGGNKGEKK